MTDHSPDQTDRILRRRMVEQMTGLPCSTLYQWISKGLFPAPIRLGPRNVGWRQSVVTEWLTTRISAR